MKPKRRSPSDPPGLDRAHIGERIRQARLMRGYTQEEAAKLSSLGVTTLFKIESGRSVRMISIKRLCLALGLAYDDLAQRRTVIHKEAGPPVVHQPQNSVWTAIGDQRKHIPVDNADLIQTPEERRRLGRLGLVPVFCSSPGFIMPEGPGAVLIELYGPRVGPINERIYRDCIVYCQRGRLRLVISGTAVELGPGGFVGYVSRDLQSIEPSDPSDEEVTTFLWLGANRLGKVPGS